MKATNHPKIIIDVDKDFKQQLIDICQLKNMSMKDYILESLEENMRSDTETLGEKLEILKKLRQD
ncbi:hypothetical protein DID80_04990 [Candidatus Marinamargulisbacteria bacterium SCGC AAA071-K20]|nr:hypothetical protein DID80_04990 [Candidatus Marinamargulisbacteria bacterium SCGC AAA071-K20]